MLNPSTADATNDDPTIKRCIAFARREGFTHLTVVNLFALRATNPRELLTAADPVGPDNDRHLAEQIERHRNSLIVAAWGANKVAISRAREITKRHGPFACLGLTKGEHPKHPLYLPNSATLRTYPPA